jgi:osmotically-inducible protein OsmY
MYKNVTAILGALVLAAASVACSPSDSGIGTTVKANLTADATLKGYQIDVGVQNKVVTLSGTVDTSSVKERAVVVARGTNGVTDVVDQVVIKNQGPGPGYGHDMMEKGMSEGKDQAAQEKRP